MSEERLPPRLELLLAAERTAAPPDGERDEVARRLTKTLGLATLGGGSAAGAAHATGGVKAIVAKSVAAKIVVAVAVGGASVGGVVGTVRLAQRHHHPAIATSAVAAPAVAAPAVAAPAVVAPAVAAPAPPTAPNSDVHRSRHSDLAAERSLLTDARSALQSGDTARALTILTAHARRFPRGQLAEERDALEIVALARAGDQPRARARAEEFVRRHPHSLFLPSVRQAAPKPGASE